MTLTLWRRLAELGRRAWYFLNRNRVTRDLEEEMRLHVELRAESLRKARVPNAESPLSTATAFSIRNDPAFHAAQKRFGNTTTIQERSRDMWGFGNLEALASDVRFAVRRLKYRRGFALSVIVVMAIGIGAVTAMFSAVDAALLRPLPFRSPEELFATSAYRVPFDDGRPENDGPARMPDLADLRRMKELASEAGAYASGAYNLADNERPIRVAVGVVTTNFFRMLGIGPLKGRVFTDAEERVGSQNVVVLSYGLWQRQYGGRDISGLRIMLGTRQHEVVGVMPRGFSFPNESDLWVPMSIPNTFATFEAFRGYIPAVTMVRLAPGVSGATAGAQTLAQMEHWYSTLDARNRKNHASGMERIRKSGTMIPLHKQLVGDRSTALYVLLGATVLLLLIACVNVTNLLLSQASARQREFALRGVLGATRVRLIRQLLTESVLLSSLGALLGVLLAPVALQMMRALMPKALAGVAAADLNLRVLVFTAVAAVLTGLAFGVGPAFRSTADGENDVLKNGGYGATAGNAGRIRRLLVSAELALTIVLLVGAGLMLRTFGEVMQRDSGLHIANVGTMQITMPGSADNRVARLRKLNDILARLDATPGIEVSGAINDLPLTGTGGISVMLQTDGPPRSKGGGPDFTRMIYASPEYFRTVGMTLLRGRAFTASDDSLAPKVVIVSRKMAEANWPGMDPIGRKVSLGEQEMTVVGVVSDVRELRLEDEAEQQMYLPLLASAPASVAIVARATMPPAALLARMTDAVRAVDRSQAVYSVRTMEDVLDSSVERRRTNALLIGTFAGLALVLASIGVFAVVSYGVSHRARELGIRAALGATGQELMHMISREMLWVTLFGVAIGLAGAWALSKTMTSLVYGVDIHDRITFVAVPIALLIPVVLATVLPARRAMRVSPSEVLRTE